MWKEKILKPHWNSEKTRKLTLLGKILIFAARTFHNICIFIIENIFIFSGFSLFIYFCLSVYLSKVFFPGVIALGIVKVPFPEIVKNLPLNYFQLHYKRKTYIFSHALMICFIQLANTPHSHPLPHPHPFYWSKELTNKWGP